MNFRTSLAAITISLAGLFSAPASLAQQKQPESKPSMTEVGEPESWERVPGVTRAAILTAEGIVGTGFAAKPLREAIPMLKAEGIDLVVIKVNSGGGLLIEVQAISDVLHDEYKPEFALVGWVDSAISAAAIASLTFEELYFMPKGNFGASTHSGVITAVKIDPEPMVRFVESIAKRGNRSYFVANAMCHNVQLSYDVDEATGEINIYQSLEGENILNYGKDILTLNANSAFECGFSDGTAKSLDELATLLEPEQGKIVWVGKEFEGVPYPLCMAERYQRNWREEIDELDERLGETYMSYTTELKAASESYFETRLLALYRAEQHLAEVKQITESYPNLGLMNGIDDDWFENQDEIIRRLRTR